MLRRLSLVITLACAIAACGPTRRGGSDDDDDAANDDDSAAIDDDDATDDDDSTPPEDDDDFVPDPQAPEIFEIEVCQVTFSGNSFGLFTIDVVDPDGDMNAPVSYRLQIGSGPLVTHEWDEPLGEAGSIAHTEQIGQSDLPRGTTHDFRFSVRDSANHWSDEEVVTWTIPANSDLEPC
ncbi:MAG: hypothetical protein GY898_02575 [Proteobacteria bacterium]|nr:hypothetical protein [Pseudomonadota bacterium]